MLSASSQSSQYQNWKANKYSVLTVIELGLPVSETSPRISKFDTPTETAPKFNKTEIEKIATHWIQSGIFLIVNPQL